MIAVQIVLEMDFGLVFKGVICGMLVKTECADWWVQDTADSERGQEDPKGTTSGYLKKRLLSGGASMVDILSLLV